MKTTKKLACLLAAAIISTSAIPTVCSAMEYPEWHSYATVKEESVRVEFVILGYKETDGELTITSCFDYSPYFRCNGGFIAVCVFNGEIKIPSYIDGKPVVGIKSLSGCQRIHKVIIPEAVTEVSDKAFRGCNLTTETIEDDYFLITLYC